MIQALTRVCNWLNHWHNPQYLNPAVIPGERSEGRGSSANHVFTNDLGLDSLPLRFAPAGNDIKNVTPT